MTLDEMIPERNTIVLTRRKWSPEWTISVDIKPVGRSYPYFTNILQMTGYKNNGYSKRIPLVSFRPNSRALHISSAVNGKGNHSFNTRPLPLKQWSNLKVSQRLLKNGVYQYGITLDGVVLHTIINHKVRTFQNVKLYISKPGKEPAHVRLKNIKVIDHGNDYE